MAKKLNNESFINKAIKVHGNKYDYSLVNYVNARTKVCIICPIHGEFWQIANDHLYGSGCAKCRGFYRTTNDWVILSNKIHNNKYNYSKSEYLGSHDKIQIICPIHGEFWQIAKEHLKYGCLKCGSMTCGDRQRFTTESFIERAQKVHGSEYDYSKSEYLGNDKSIIISCKTHGDFVTTPHTHLAGHCCPTCTNLISYYENKLYESILYKYKETDIIKQFKSDWLRYKQKMSIDIFLKNYNIAIEYQGGQHFKSVNFYGGLNKFNKQIIRDELKFNLCQQNNVTLLYFSYFKTEPKNYKHKIFHNEDELFLEIDNLIKKHINKIK